MAVDSLKGLQGRASLVNDPLPLEAPHEFADGLATRHERRLQVLQEPHIFDHLGLISQISQHPREARTDILCLDLSQQGRSSSRCYRTPTCPRNDLLVRGGARVNDVGRLFETFVLHGVEQQVIVFLEDRLDGLARSRRSAAEYDADLLLSNEPFRAAGKRGPDRSHGGTRTRVGCGTTTDGRERGSTPGLHKPTPSGRFCLDALVFRVQALQF